MRLVTYQIDYAKIADLNDEQLLANIGSSVQELRCAWEDIATQRIEPTTCDLPSNCKHLELTEYWCAALYPVVQPKTKTWFYGNGLMQD